MGNLQEDTEVLIPAEYRYFTGCARIFKKEKELVPRRVSIPKY